MARWRVLSVVFPCFIPEYDAVLYARIIAKMDCSFSPFTRLWAHNEASYPPFLSPLHPKTSPLHPCHDARNPVSSYPKNPFGMSHFTIWGIFSAHFRTMYSSIFGLSSSFSQQKFVCFLSFRFIMFLRDSLGWIKYIL